MRRHVFAGVVLLAFAAPVSAEPLKLSQSLFVGVQVADTWTTSRAISSGRGRESNAIMQGSDAKRIAVKSATTAGTLYLASKLSPHHPTAEKMFLYSVSGVVGAVALRNARIGR